LKSAGCERIFAEQVSGKSTNGRGELKKLLKAARPGDTVVVVKLRRPEGAALSARQGPVSPRGGNPWG
jgi:DNA invertase Pin-like site-specific DNA recombinase